MFGDLKSQAAAAASDEGEEVTTPVTPSTQVAQQPEAQAPQPLTLEMLTQVLDQRDEKLTRQIQSTVDKTSTRLEQRIAQARADTKRALDAFKALPNVTAEQVAQAEQVLERQVMQKAMEPEQPPAGEQPPQGQQPQMTPQRQEEVRIVNAQAQGFMDWVGLTPTDPEFKEINTQAGTAQEYLDSVKAACLKRQARGSQPPNLAQVPAVRPSGGPPAKKPVFADEENVEALLDMEFNAELAKRRS
jgi:hypothetical protein